MPRRLLFEGQGERAVGPRRGEAGPEGPVHLGSVEMEKDRVGEDCVEGTTKVISAHVQDRAW